MIRSNVHKSLFLGGLLSFFVVDTASTAIVIIDPGHGGRFLGCVSAQKLLVEKTLALDIARRVSNILKKQ